MRTEFTDGPILLRPYQREDVPLLLEAVRESQPELAPWMAWCHPKYSLEDSTAFVQSRRHEWENGLHYSFAIFNSDNGRFLGGTGINFINRIHRFANLGYWIRTSETRRGIATKAVRLTSEFGFEELNLVRLEIVVALANIASSRVAEKAGAKREGLLRNRLFLNGRVHQAALFSLVAEDLNK